MSSVVVKSKKLFSVIKGLYSSVRTMVKNIPFADTIMEFAEKAYALYTDKKAADAVVAHALMLGQDLMLMVQAYHVCLDSFPGMPGKATCEGELKKVETSLKELTSVWQKYASRSFLSKLWNSKEDAKKISKNEESLKEVTLIVTGKINAHVNTQQNIKMESQKKRILALTESLKDLPTRMEMEAAVAEAFAKHGEKLHEDINVVQQIAVKAQLTAEQYAEEVKALEGKLEKKLTADIEAYKIEYAQHQREIAARQEKMSLKLAELVDTTEQHRQDIEALKTANKKQEKELEELKKLVGVLIKTSETNQETALQAYTKARMMELNILTQAMKCPNKGYASKFIPQNENILKAVGLYERKLTLENSKGVETIKWKKNLRWVKEDYEVCTYKTCDGKVLLVMVATKISKPPTSFVVKPGGVPGKPKTLHFAYYPEKKEAQVFLVIHDNSWGPYQNRFSDSSKVVGQLSQLFKNRVERRLAYVKRMSKYVPALTSATEKVNQFGKAVQGLFEGMVGDWCRYVG